LSVVQLVKQRLGLHQDWRVEAFGEPVVDRSEKFSGLIPLPLIAPELDSLGASRNTMTIDAALVRWTPRETPASPPVRQMCRSRYIRVNTN
jgi:hypothetical protein